jgi:iron complex outermembrane receptor protein
MVCMRAPSMRGHRRTVAAIVMGAALNPLTGISCGATAPTAADPEASEQSGLAEVIVTARRRAENAQEVPIPITAVSGSVLEQAGQYRIEDLNARLPSFNAEFANPRQTSIAIRGLGNNPANDGLESSVGVYLDDVYLGRPGMVNQDLADIDQVSVLRGPQGTLFGKNTTAGVLMITTRQPSFTPEGMVQTDVGNDGYFQVRGTVSGPVHDDDLAGRLSYAKTSRDGFIESVTDGRRLNGVDRLGLRGQLLFKPSDVLSVRVIGDYEAEDSPCCVAVLANLGPDQGALLTSRLAAAHATEIYDPDYLSSSINDPQHTHVRQGGGSIQVNWRFDGGYDLTSITAFRSWQYLPMNDSDNTSASASVDVGQSVHDAQWSEEIRLASPSTGTVVWVAGLYYFYQNQKNLGYTQYGAAAQALYALPSFYNDAYSQVWSYPKTDSYAAFAQSTWHVSQAWSLTAGLRDTQEQKTSDIERDAPTGGRGIEQALPAYDSGPLKISNNNVSALFSLDFQFDSDIMGYLSVSRGAKAGGINESIPSAGLSASSLYVAPETATDYELGLKSTPFDQHLLFNVNAFWTEVKDYQATRLEQSTLGLFVQTLSNIGGVRTRGVEAELTAKPLDGIAFDLNASYDDAVYASYVNAPCSVESARASMITCNLTGQSLVGAPRWIVNPDIYASRALGGTVRAYSLLGYAWRSDYFGTPDNSRYGKVPGYGLLNLRLGLRGQVAANPWEFALWASNALDRRYLVGGLGAATFGVYSLYPGPPRFWGATLRMEF